MLQFLNEELIGGVNGEHFWSGAPIRRAWPTGLAPTNPFEMTFHRISRVQHI